MNVGQGAYIFGCNGLTLSADEKAFFADANPWGFIVFARNIETPDQLRRLTGDLRDAVGRDAPILIDQEGGRVERMTQPHWRHWLPPLDQVAKNPPMAERGMYLRYRMIADELRAVGIDANCAPVADIAHEATHAVLKNRCYSRDPQQVAGISRAVANGLLAGGVLPIVKHIPGHGRATIDSHLELPHVAASVDDLCKSDFAVMKSLADLPIGMSAHIVYENIDPERPATTSPRMTGIIRDDIGFGGLLMSDDISMQALKGDLSARCTKSLSAGIDMILHCNGDLDEMQIVADVSGAMNDAAQAGADHAIAQRTVPDAFDIAAYEAELLQILNGHAHG